jgi:hypothetical protein
MRRRSVSPCFTLRAVIDPLAVGEPPFGAWSPAALRAVESGGSTPYSPGPIDTPIMDVQVPRNEAADALRADFARMMPLGRLGTAEQMANAVLLLASSDSSYCTGIDLVADAGFTQLSGSASRASRSARARGLEPAGATPSPVRRAHLAAQPGILSAAPPTTLSLAARHAGAAIIVGHDARSTDDLDVPLDEPHRP